MLFTLVPKGVGSGLALSPSTRGFGVSVVNSSSGFWGKVPATQWFFLYLWCNETPSEMEKWVKYAIIGVCMQTVRGLVAGLDPENKILRVSRLKPLGPTKLAPMD